MVVDAFLVPGTIFRTIGQRRWATITATTMRANVAMFSVVNIFFITRGARTGV